jgi:hypothetical protein
MTPTLNALPPERVEAAQLTTALKVARETFITQRQTASKDVKDSGQKREAVIQAQLRYHIRCTALLLKAQGLKWSDLTAELPAEMRTGFLSSK